MSGLIAFHRLAAARGDGLHPKPAELLERRAVLIETNPRVVDLGAHRGGALVQAGPGPTPKMPDFLPGNVVGFAPKAQAYAEPVRRKSPASRS